MSPGWCDQILSMCELPSHSGLFKIHPTHTVSIWYLYTLPCTVPGQVPTPADVLSLAGSCDAVVARSQAGLTGTLEHFQLVLHDQAIVMNMELH